MKRSQILDNLRGISESLRCNHIPCDRKFTQKGVPYIKTAFGHRIVYFGKTKVYRLFMPTHDFVEEQERIDFSRMSRYEVGKSIVETIRERARDGYAVSPPLPPVRTPPPAIMCFSRRFIRRLV